MSDNTAPRAEDRVNTYAIVVVGLVGALLTYVSIVALQAYYASTINAEQSVKDVAGMGQGYQSLKAEQVARLSDYGRAGDRMRLPIETAKDLVVEDARNGASSLVPGVGEHDTPTVDPATGKAIGAPAAPETEGAAAPGGAQAPADGAAPGGAQAPADSAAPATSPPATGGGAADAPTATDPGGDEATP